MNIIKLAEKAGFEVVDKKLQLYYDGDKIILKPNLMGNVTDGLKEFAVLVRAEALAEHMKQEPKYWTYMANGTWRWIVEQEPEEDMYDEGSLEPLYAAPVQPVKQEPVAIKEQCIAIARMYNNSGEGGVIAQEIEKLYAAPVDTKAIRAEALEEAAVICESKQWNDEFECAAAIRGLK